MGLSRSTGCALNSSIIQCSLAHVLLSASRQVDFIESFALGFMVMLSLLFAS